MRSLVVIEQTLDIMAEATSVLLDATMEAGGVGRHRQTRGAHGKEGRSNDFSIELASMLSLGAASLLSHSQDSEGGTSSFYLCGWRWNSWSWFVACCLLPLPPAPASSQPASHPAPAAARPPAAVGILPPQYIRVPTILLTVGTPGDGRTILPQPHIFGGSSHPHLTHAPISPQTSSASAADAADDDDDIRYGSRCHNPPASSRMPSPLTVAPLSPPKHWQDHIHITLSSWYWYW